MEMMLVGVVMGVLYMEVAKVAYMEAKKVKM